MTLALTLGKKENEMGDYDAVFESVGNAKSLGGFTPRLGIGQHQLLLKKYAVKESSKGKGKILEADFVILGSSVHQAGEVRGWAWFIGSQGWAGAYEEARAKAFIEVVGLCIGDNSPVSQIGAALASPSQNGRGLRVDAVITAQTDRAGNPKMSNKNEIYTDIKWMVVQQTVADIQQNRAALDAQMPETPQAARPAAVIPAAQVQPQMTNPGLAAGVSGFLTSLKK